MPQELKNRINSDFSFHKANAEDHQKFVDIRRLAKDYALYLEKACPKGRELSAALSKLEECVFWANAGVARQGEVV